MTTNLSFAGMHDELRAASLEKLPSLRIAVLRNVTIEPIEAHLRYVAHKDGFNAEVAFGRFDNIVQDATDPGSAVWQAQADIVLVFASVETLSQQLASRFTALAPQDTAGEVERVSAFVDATLQGLRRHTAATVLWHGFETPLDPALGIYDSQIDHGQLGVIRQLNARLKEKLRRAGNAYFVDLDLCVARLGANAFFDRRYWHLGRAPYSLAALELIAAEDFKFVRALTGATKKCLVLDCDGVLWGGTIGEDGVDGIALSQHHPGSCHQELQETVLSLHHRGVILALCSKNNEEDVRQVFREHPGMVLREHHISAARINWADKATNLKSLAAELNIGLNSMVFVDDSEFEVELVRAALPDVEVIHLPAARAVEFKHILAAPGWFDALTVSEADRERGEMYRAEAERRRLLAEQPDLAGYLASLDLKVDVQAVDERSLARVAQLTQRTNQFNLTAKRYSEDDIRSLVGSSNCRALTVQVSDRFGNYGLTGAAILKFNAGNCEIDTLLLSCRVIGRGIEDVLLSACLKVARQRSIQRVRARRVKTAKNGLVANFYAERGFTVERDEDQETAYWMDLDEVERDWPAHILSVKMDGLLGERQ